MSYHGVGKKLIAGITAALVMTTMLTGCGLSLNMDDGNTMSIDLDDDNNISINMEDEKTGRKEVAQMPADDEKDKGSDDAIIENVVDNFMILAAVPRQSKHEKEISDRLKAWAEDLGYDVRQNKANDLIFDVPATEGLEDLPLTALQAHMDMVCVAEKGVDFDPENDDIKVVVDREAGTMTTGGTTTLGSDDGAGVAVIMSIVEGGMKHGPLRVILTTDEEVDMTGALAITSKDLEGVKYLINIDSEASDTVTISSAAGGSIVVYDKPVLTDASKDSALKINISGLVGGHSGVMINEGRCNAIVTIAGLLSELSDTVPFELASITGGVAQNAIPAECEAVILVDKKDEAEVKDYIDEAEKELKKEYKGIEENLAVSVSGCDRPDEVLDDRQTKSILDFITGSINGVYTMSKDVESFVESSSNIGVINVGDKSVDIEAMYRSSSEEKMEEIAGFQEKLAKKTGLPIDIDVDAKPWPIKTDSVLVPRIQEIYKAQNGEDIKVEAIHAGLECGVFAELSEDLDMVSIGPDVVGAHSPEETLYIDSIPKIWHLLEELLSNII
ncbi:MAG: beta-Ala-His dipeptidase [Lachnospiraceae bacterium]|nr:beta-Ala-His dipeptidase [Lachnospiraceae bacterium]